LGEDEGKKVNEGTERKEDQEGFAVDLESMGIQLKKKNTKGKQSKTKAPKDAREKRRRRHRFSYKKRHKKWKKRRARKRWPSALSA
jgi:hypothetical protein